MPWAGRQDSQWPGDSSAPLVSEPGPGAWLRRETLLLDGPRTLALTTQLTTKELKAQGAAPVTDKGHQPHILHLQRQVKHAGLQAVVVPIPLKYLGRRADCRSGQSLFLGLPLSSAGLWGDQGA